MLRTLCLLLLASIALGATADQRPLVLSTTTGTPVQIPAGNRISLPTASGGFYATIDPGVQTATRVFTLPVATGGDTLDSLGTVATFTALKTFSAGATIKTPITFQDGTDATKQWSLSLSGMTTAKTLTIASAQTTSQTLNLPNITATDTVAVLGLTQSFTAAHGINSQPVGGESVGFWSNWSGSANAVRGIQSYSAYTGSFGSTAYDGVVTQSGNTAFDHIVCYQGTAGITSGSANAAFLAGAYMSGSHAGSGTVTNSYGYYWGGWTGAGTITNKYAFFSASSEPNYFGGNVYCNGKLSVGTGTVGQTLTINSAGNVIFEVQQAGSTIGYLANGSAIFGGASASDFAFNAASSGKKVILGNAGVRGIEVVDGVANCPGTADATAIGTATFTVQGGGSFAKSIGLGAIAAPGSPFMGQIWNDSTRQGLMTFAGSSTANGIKQSLSSCLFTMYANVSRSNTNVENSLLTGTAIGTRTLPANFWTVGKSVRIKWSGNVSNGGGGTHTFLVYYGATQVITRGATLTGTLSGAAINAEAILTCSAVGVSGTLNATLHVDYENAGAGQKLGNALNAVTINTTTSNALDFTELMSVASASNTVSAYVASIEVLN